MQRHSRAWRWDGTRQAAMSVLKVSAEGAQPASPMRRSTPSASCRLRVPGRSGSAPGSRA